MLNVIRLIAFILIIFRGTIELHAQNPVLPCPMPEAVSEFPSGDWFYSMALSPNSEQLAVVARSGIYLFDPIMLTLVKTLICFDGLFDGYTLAWSPDSQYLAHVQNQYNTVTENRDYNLRIWDVNQQSMVTQLDIMDLPDWAYCSIETLSWSSDGNYLAMSCPMYVLSVADITQPELVFTSHQATASDDWTILPSTFAWSSDERLLAIAQGDTISLWNTETWEEVERLPVELTSSISTGVTTLSWTSAGYLAAGGYGQPLYLWDTRTWAEARLSTSYEAHIVEFLPATSLLAFAGDAGDYSREWRSRIITILDVSTNRVIQRFVVPDIPNVEDARGTYVQRIQWLPDEERLLSLQTEGTTSSVISLWDIESGEMLAEVSLSPFGG